MLGGEWEGEGRDAVGLGMELLSVVGEDKEVDLEVVRPLLPRAPCAAARLS